MTAQQQMRRMLDELMGTARNGGSETNKVHFSDNKVCKGFLMRCCPHSIFSATRCDLGPCPRIHDFALRADFDAAVKRDEYDFSEEVLKLLRAFIAEADRRARFSKQRLIEMQQVLTAEENIKLHSIKILESKLEEALANAEKLGAEGNVEESAKALDLVEELQNEKDVAEKDYRKSMPTSKQQQQSLRVCEVCASYLGLEQDQDDRLASHFQGKMHLGFVEIREKIDQLENDIQDKQIKKFLDKEFQTINQCYPPVEMQQTTSINLDVGTNSQLESPSKKIRLE